MILSEIDGNNRFTFINMNDDIHISNRIKFLNREGIGLIENIKCP